MLDEEFGPAALATYQEMPLGSNPYGKMLLSNKGYFSAYTVGVISKS